MEAAQVQKNEMQENNVSEEAKPGDFKKRKREEQKLNAGNRAAWNTLFMRADTVAEAIASHFGISKSQLLDKEAAGLYN